MATTSGNDMSPHVERSLRTLFKRCVQCPPQSPSCPTCPDDQICSLVPQDCHKCAHMTCIKNPTPAPTSGGPNVGAIAGGVVGGVAFISIVVFLVWFFWIKKRRQEQDAELEEEWANDEIASQKRSTRFNSILDGAESTRTRGSLANSILSRASNIIQIAYIPGVTNRNGSTNSIHGPVPPIPAAHRSAPPKSPLSHEGDALFFRPGDLRDSTWSETASIASSSTDKRGTRYNRDTVTSISPSLLRDSVASEAFMDATALQPGPATAATILAPRMVSVKSKASSSSLSSSISPNPATPAPEEGTGGKVTHLQVMMPGQTSASPSLSPQPSVRSAGKVKQVNIPSRENSTKGRLPPRQTSEASLWAAKHVPNVPSPLSQRDEDTESTGSHLVSPIGTPQPTDSPFFDASELLNNFPAAPSAPSAPSVPSAPSSSSNTPPKPNPYATLASSIRTSTDGPPRRGKSIGGLGGLTAVIEEERKRVSSSYYSQSETAEGEKKDERNPFGDEHASE